MASNLTHLMSHDSIPLSKRLAYAENFDAETWDATRKSALRGRDVNWKTGINALDDNTDLSPLMLTAIQGKPDLAIALIERGAQLELTTSLATVSRLKRRTALHFAAQYGQLEVMIVLLKRGSVIGARDHFDITPLHLSAKGGFRDCVQELLNRGANVNACDRFGRTPLHFAAQFGHHEICGMLLQANAAVEIRDRETGVALPPASPNATTPTAEDEQEGVVSMAMLERYHRHSRGEMTEEQKKAIEEATLANEDDWQGGGYTALHYAAQYGRKETVICLLRYGARVDRPSLTEKLSALMLAAREGNKSIVSILISQGADVNRCDIHGWTALHYASSWGRRDTLMILIVEGRGDVNGRYPNLLGEGGITPLIIAVRGDQAEVARTLLAYGADPNLPEMAEGESPIHAAARTGHTVILEMLISHGVKVNLQSFVDGRTPLMDAIVTGQRGSILLLLNNCADLNILDHHERVAWQYARTTWQRDVFLSTLPLLNPSAKVNLLPWLEENLSSLPSGRGGYQNLMKSFQNSDASLRGVGSPSFFMRAFLRDFHGLYFGLFNLPPSCDIYLVSAFVMIIAMCRRTQFTLARRHSSHLWRSHGSRDNAMLEEIINEVEDALIRIMESTMLATDEAITDAWSLPSVSVASLGVFQPYYFSRALFSGPLALYLDTDCERLLSSPTLSARIEESLWTIHVPVGNVVDGYGEVSRIGQIRYLPAAMFLLEGLGRLVIFIIVCAYGINGGSTESFSYSYTGTRPSAGLGSRSGSEIGVWEVIVLGLMCSLCIYELGILEELRWGTTPSTIVSVASLEERRWSRVWNHWKTDIYTTLDTLTACLAAVYFILRLFAPDHEYIQISSLILYTALVPLGIGLIRYPGLLVPRLGQAALTAGCVAQSITSYIVVMIFVGVGFGSALYALQKSDFFAFSTQGQTLQSLGFAMFGIIPEELSSSEMYSGFSSSSMSGTSSPVLMFVLIWSFLIIVIAFLFPALITSAAHEIGDSKRQEIRWMSYQTRLLRRFVLIEEKSALSILPPPLSIIGLISYPLHTWTIWRAKLALKRRTVLSVTGSIANVVLALLHLPFAIFYEYWCVTIQASNAGFLRKLFWMTIYAPVGLSYVGFCLIWKVINDGYAETRLAVKSRLVDGRLRLAHGGYRGKWDLDSLFEVNDPRLNATMRHFANDIFTDPPRSAKAAVATSQTTPEDSMSEAQLTQQVHLAHFNNFFTALEARRANLSGYSYPATYFPPMKERTKPSPQTHNDPELFHAEGENDYDSEASDGAYSVKSVDLEPQQLSLWHSVDRQLSRQRRRELTSQYRGRRVRIAPSTPFLELAKVGAVEELVPGMVSLRHPYQRNWTKPAMPLRDNGSTALAGSDLYGELRSTAGAADSFGDSDDEDTPLRLQPSVQSTAMVVVNNDAEEATSAQLQAYENLQSQNEPQEPLPQEQQRPNLLWSQYQEEINPYQVGVESEAHWTKLMTDQEGELHAPTSTSVVNEAATVLSARRHEVPPGEGVSKTTIQRQGEIASYHAKLTRDSSTRQDTRESRRDAKLTHATSRQQVQNQRKKETKQLLKQRDQDLAFESSFYFPTSRFSPILTEEERIYVFRSLLPNTFLTDEARAIEHLVGRFRM